MAQRKRPGSEMNFETSLQKLEAIVKRLEEEEVPLEQSLKLFAEGQALARACEVQLKAAENQIRLILENPSGKITESAFEGENQADPTAPATAGADEDDADEDDEEEGGDNETSTPPTAAENNDDEPPAPRQAAPAHSLDELPF